MRMFDEVLGNQERVSELPDRSRDLAFARWRDDDLSRFCQQREVLARARKFLADRGIAAAAVIHREDAIHFMMESSLFEQAISRPDAPESTQLKSTRGS